MMSKDYQYSGILLQDPLLWLHEQVEHRAVQSAYSVEGVLFLLPLTCICMSMAFVPYRKASLTSKDSTNSVILLQDRLLWVCELVKYRVWCRAGKKWYNSHFLGLGMNERHVMTCHKRNDVRKVVSCFQVLFPARGLDKSSLVMGFSYPAEIASNATATSNTHSFVYPQVVNHGVLLWFRVQPFFSFPREANYRTHVPDDDVPQDWRPAQPVDTILPSERPTAGREGCCLFLPLRCERQAFLPFR